MNTQEAVQALDGQHATPLNELGRNSTWINGGSGLAFRFNPLADNWERYPLADVKCVEPAPCGSYASLKPADAVAHLNEVLSSEIERFEHDTSLRLASVKVLRDRKAGDIFVKVQAHVR